MSAPTSDDLNHEEVIPNQTPQKRLYAILGIF